MAVDTLSRIKLWTLEEEGADPEYFGKVDVGSALTYEALRIILEGNDLLEWPFEFWDVEDKGRVRKKLERVNVFGAEVHVIRAGQEDTESQKRRRLEGGVVAAINIEVSPAV